MRFIAYENIINIQIVYPNWYDIMYIVYNCLILYNNYGTLNTHILGKFWYHT